MIHVDIYMTKQRGEAAEHITEPVEILRVTGFRAAEHPELPEKTLTKAGELEQAVQSYIPSQLSGG